MERSNLCHANIFLADVPSGGRTKITSDEIRKGRNQAEGKASRAEYQFDSSGRRTESGQIGRNWIFCPSRYAAKHRRWRRRGKKGRETKEWPSPRRFTTRRWFYASFGWPRVKKLRIARLDYGGSFGRWEFVSGTGPSRSRVFSSELWWSAYNLGVPRFIKRFRRNSWNFGNLIDEVCVNRVGNGLKFAFVFCSMAKIYWTNINREEGRLFFFS